MLAAAGHHPMAAGLLPGYGRGMTKKKLLTADKAFLIAGTLFLAALTGCAVEGRGRGGMAQVQTTAAYQDDYDYYPGYETYYSRNRHEYVYRDGNAWVRRPAPQGVTTEVILASPSIRVDFHDSPEQHHSNVVKSYPKTWKNPNVKPEPKRTDVKDDHRDEKKNDAKDDHRDDRKDGDKKN
jgi:hypothetical protein